MKEEYRLHYGLISKYRPVLMSVAILLIMFCHLSSGQSHHGVAVTRLASILEAGNSGVDMFLFLSGVGLYYSYTQKPLSYWAFERKRFKRIIPYYLVIAGATYLILSFLRNSFSLSKYICDLFYLTWFIEGSTYYWYVFAICVFYMSFPAIYSFIYNNERPFLWALFFCLSWFVGVKLLGSYWGYIKHFRIMLERFPIFVLGVYTGKLAYRKVKIKRSYCVFFILSGTALLALQKYALHGFLETQLRYPSRSAFAISIITSVILLMEYLENTVPWTHSILMKLLGWYGGLTYELYLLHQSFRLLLDFPYKPIGYFVSAFALPTVTATGIWWVRKRMASRQLFGTAQTH